MRIVLSALALAILTSQLSAAESVYTKLNLEQNCVFHSSYEAGGSAYCDGYKGYPVHFDEGDLRQMVRFGHVAVLDGQWESFGQFNRVNDKIEWRLDGTKPYAAILRWFIENTNSNGEVDEASLGQVLVVSTVASHENPTSCVVGYIDAKANPNANVLARNVADGFAPAFKCGSDQPSYHGQRGNLSGIPSRHFE